MNSRKIHPLLNLLFIPGAALVDIIILFVAILIDSSKMPDAGGQGHAMPAFTIIAFFLIIIVSVAGVVLAIVLTITKSAKKKKAKAAAAAVFETASVAIPAQTEEKKKNPKALLFLLIGPTQAAIAYIFCMLCVFLELSLEEPPQIGFPIPVFSIILIIICAILTVIAVIVSVILTIVFFNKRKK